MSYSSTYNETTTFTLSHARHIASKVAADLERMRCFYGSPTESWILEFEQELAILLRNGFVQEVTYGFCRNGQFIEPTLRYTAESLAGSAPDNDPGRVMPGANVAGATFYSFLSYTPSWLRATEAKRTAVTLELPFQRGVGAEPSVNGYLVADRLYSAGGRSLARSTVRSFQ